MSEEYAEATINPDGTFENDAGAGAGAEADPDDMGGEDGFAGAEGEAMFEEDNETDPVVYLVLLVVLIASISIFIWYRAKKDQGDAFFDSVDGEKVSLHEFHSLTGFPVPIYLYGWIFPIHVFAFSCCVCCVFSILLFDLTLCMRVATTTYYYHYYHYNYYCYSLTSSCPMQLRSTTLSEPKPKRTDGNQARVPKMRRQQLLVVLIATWHKLS